jgi:hypothetical protein
VKYDQRLPLVFFFLFVCFNLKRLGEPCRMWFVLL